VTPFINYQEVEMTKSKKQKINRTVGESKELVKQEYTQEERQRIVHYTKRSGGKLPKFKINKMSSGKPMLEIQENDKELVAVKMMESLGTPDKELQSLLLNQAMETFRGCHSSEGYDDDRLAEFTNNAMAILQGICPEDEIEGMLAIQMIGVHNMAMTIMSRTMITDQTFEGRQAGVSQATKMLRTFTAQMEALKKYRTGGEQKVIVEHVHVNEGGQAIVGNVTQGGGGNDEK
jgi:hypothetical protein